MDLFDGEPKGRDCTRDPRTVVSKSRTRDRTPFGNNTYRQCERIRSPKTLGRKERHRDRIHRTTHASAEWCRERLNRLLLEIARAILISAKVPKRYWPWAIKMANHIRN